MGPNRASRTEALSQLRQTRALEGLPRTLETVGTPVAVLNDHRQVIFANRAYRELTAPRSVEDMCGERIGEILGCINADAGCGESSACPYCGAFQAIQETLRTGQACARECHIGVGAPGRGSGLDLMVHATPFEIGVARYVMASFVDISHQKRRAALERIFFHDILNTTSSFKVYLDLLQRSAKDNGSRDLVTRLVSICDTLEEEITGQKLLLSAENGTLQAQRNLIDSHDLALQVMRQVEGQDVAKGRSVCLAPFSESFTFISDDTLVKRVLANMLKNALEASPAGAAVSIGFRKDGEAARFHVHNPTCMEQDVQRQVFRRYFSTKGNDRGLGTWGMRMLAEDYLGGKVAFTSTQADGTTFTLTLPLKPPDL